jgi:hypothetical protein
MNALSFFSPHKLGFSLFTLSIMAFSVLSFSLKNVSP